MYCSIKGCKSRSIKGGNIRFFSIPKDAPMAEAWMRYCKPTSNIKLEHRRVCSEHFAPSAYLYRNYLLTGPKRGRILKNDAVPTLKITIDGDNIHTNHKQPIPDQDIRTLIENNLQTLRSQQMRKPTDEFKGDQITISVNEYKILTSYMEKYINIKNNLSHICTPEKIRILMRAIER